MAGRSTPRKTQQQHKQILKQSTICHICGHDGADAVDHVIPLTQGGSDTPDNKRPAHHRQPCPTCGRKCNREKGGKLVPNIIRTSGMLRTD